MQYLVYGGTATSRQTKVHSLYPQKDYLYYHLSKDPKSIAVQTVRTLLSTLFIRPTRARVVWIEEAEALGIAGQNTLLKALEEPPELTHFILSVATKASLLPTIQSRLIGVPVGRELVLADQDILSEIKQSLYLSTAGERILKAETLGRDRQECILWIQKLLASLYQTLLETKPQNQQKLLCTIAKSAISSERRLTQNANVNLTMQSFFLELPVLK